jgi:nicotinate dehydrogenase subunit B
MTGFLHERELSRKTFLKGSGALVVGFSLLGAGLGTKAAKAVGEDPFASNGPVDMYEVNSWLRIHADNTASLYTHSIEMGQGGPLGLLMIAADELDMDLSQLKFMIDDTNVMPDTGRTAGSKSIRSAGPKVRAASAHARQALLGLASASLGVATSQLTVSKGVVSGGGKQITYGQLIGDKLLNVRMPASYGFRALSAGIDTSTGDTTGLWQNVAPAKATSQYKLVGTRVPRLDIPDKVTGKYVYIHNVRIPGMLHGRVVRPRGQGAVGSGRASAILSVDESSIRHIPGARVVRKGNFLGVIAPKEYDAIQAAAQLKVKWADTPKISSSGNLWKSMRDFDAAGQAPARHQVDVGNVDAALKSAAKVVSQTYKYAYNAHGVIGPSCAVADVRSNAALILCNSQDSYVLRSKLSALLSLPVNRIRVRYFEGSSTYGCSPCRYETSQAAAMLSQLAGAPVRLQFMRWDEQGWGNYSPATMVDIRAGIDANGNIVAHHYTGILMPGMPVELIPQWDPTALQSGLFTQPAPGLASANDYGGAARQQVYNIPNVRVTAKSLPLMDNYFVTQTIRAPGWIQAAWASESMIDELATAANMDPIAFRVKNFVADPGGRKLAVVEALKSISKWQPKVSASKLATGDVVTGRGVAFANNGDFSPGSLSTYAGAVADIEVNKKTGKIVVKQLYLAQDAGLTINPGLVENQMIGGSVQSVSRALHEEVGFDTKRVTSLDWTTYPILRFKDSPKVATTVVQHVDEKSNSAGEETVPPIPPAIAAAFFDATGVRLRETPMIPARVRGALKAAGVA